MSDKKIIAVLGATGAQGGGLVRAILEDQSKEFIVRAFGAGFPAQPARKRGLDEEPLRSNASDRRRTHGDRRHCADIRA